MTDAQFTCVSGPVTDFRNTDQVFFWGLSDVLKEELGLWGLGEKDHRGKVPSL